MGPARLDRHRDLNPKIQMRITWQRLNRCGCIPRIAKVVDQIPRVRAGVPASRCGQASFPSSGELEQIPVEFTYNLRA